MKCVIPLLVVGKFTPVIDAELVARRIIVESGGIVTNSLLTGIRSIFVKKGGKVRNSTLVCLSNARRVWYTGDEGGLHCYYNCCFRRKETKRKKK